MKRAGGYALAMALLAVCAPAGALDRILVTAEEVTAGTVTAHDVQLTLEIPSSRRSVLDARVGEIDLPAVVRAQTGRLTTLHLRCENPAFREPRLDCPAFTFEGRAARLPPLEIEGDTHVDVDRGFMRLDGRGPTLAGAQAAFEFEGTAKDFNAMASLPSLEFTAIAELVAPWFPLPADITPKGRAALSLEASSTGGDAVATLHADVTDVDYSNAEGTVVVDKARGKLRARLHELRTLDAEFVLDATGGEVLAGPVYFDLKGNPIRTRIRGTLDADVLQLTDIQFSQLDLARVGGTARLRLEPFGVEAAQLEIAELRFPAAYRSLMQIALTTTPFSQLTTSGRASGSLRIANDLPVAIDLALKDFALSDTQRQIDVRGIDADVHWAAGVTGPPRPSFIAWESARGWNVAGGRSRVDFAMQDRDVRLLKPARLPLWDGALVVNQLEALNVGSDQLAGSFDATLEPIGLEQITRAFGWPQFGGRIAGRIPGLTYKDRLLTVQGDLEASVFDGTVTARRLRVRDPLGAWPRLYADITARNIDLEKLTNTFSFGSITGRLDGDLLGLETFNWSPVAFDLRLATPANDKSRHRISQKALKNLANFGGGGAGVAAALQSGAIRFFDTFRYDRIGLSCKLANDVCQMGGAEPAKNGYYIVKGSGLPRIDVIGTETRVNWPLLLAQTSAALANTGDIRID